MEQPKLKSIELLSDGWLKKYLMKYDLPNGQVKTYDSISRKSPDAYLAELQRGERPPYIDAVSIVATTDDDEILLIKEFRYPLNSWCIAFPAGLVDPGEDVVRCACREMEEETGYTVSADAQVRVLPQAGFSSTGFTDETVQVVFVEAEKAGDAHTEPNELIEVFELPIAAIPEFLNTNPLPIGTRAQLVLESFIQ